MKKNSLMEGAIIATLAIILSKVLGVLYVIPFYRIIGEQGGALYGYAYNIYNLFLVISSAGIPLAISKLTSEFETKKEYAKKQAMFDIAQKAIRYFAIISFIICFVFAKPIAQIILGEISGGNTIEDVTIVIRAIAFALLVVPLLSVFRGYLQGHKYISPSSFSQVIEQIVRISFILIGSYIAIKVLKIPLAYAVAMSVFSAFIGAVIAYIYLHIKTKKSGVLDKSQKKQISAEDKKEIIQKIIGYSIPFIVVNIANSIYNTTDMILIIRGLNMLGYSAPDIEMISSVFTTWGEKLNTIIRAFATGLTVSLIPSMVSAYVLKNREEVNRYFNKVLLVLTYIILPITLFVSFFANEVWNVFYGPSTYGPIIIKYTILVVVLDSAYLLMGTSLQGMYKTKLIYQSVFSGLLTNVILDLPLMFLFNELNIYPFYGAITATVIGYIVSLIIPFVSLYRNDHFSYQETIYKIPSIIISNIILVITCMLYKKIIPPVSGTFKTLIYLGVIGVISFAIYYLVNRKTINSILEFKFKKNKKDVIK